MTSVPNPVSKARDECCHSSRFFVPQNIDLFVKVAHFNHTVRFNMATSVSAPIMHCEQIGS